MKSSPHRRLLKRAVVGATTACALGVLSFVAFESDGELALTYTAGGLIAGAISITQFQRYSLPSWRAGIPLFYFVMFFVIPMFQQLSGFADYIGNESVARAWLLCTFGLAIFSGTTIAIDAQTAKQTASHRAIEDRWPLREIDSLTGAWIVLAVGAIATFWSVRYGYFGLQIVDADRRTSTSGVVSTLAVLIDVSAMISWARVFGRQEDRRLGQWLAIAAVATLVGLYFSLYSNSKAALIKPLLILALTYFTLRRSISLPVVAAVVLLYALFVYPFITTFRIQYDQGGMSGIELFRDSLYHLVSLDWVYGKAAVVALSGDSEAFSSLGRGLFLSFSNIVETVSTRGFVETNTFVSAVLFLVPRAIWPSKPEETVGNLVGHFIGILHPSDTVTNVSPTQMGEFYMNFGTLGIMWGMLIWGGMAHFADTIVRKGSNSWLSVFLFLMVPLQESTFGQGILSFVKSLPVQISALMFIAFIAQLAGRSRSSLDKLRVGRKGDNWSR